jgi:hypothetical protein
MENEIWKDIIGYEGYYQISNLGRVKSLDRIVDNRRGQFLRKGRFLKPYKSTKAYMLLGLCVNGKMKAFTFHRILAKHFIPNPENKKEINHKNGVRDDNRLENLEWVTGSENIRHSFKVLKRKKMTGEKHPMHKLTESNVIEIKKIYNAGGISYKRLGEIYNVSDVTIGRVVRGDHWKTIKCA